MARLLEIETELGVIRWTRGKRGGNRPTGDASALAMIGVHRGGSYGCIPGAPAEFAHGRKDSFLHLVATVFPEHRVIFDDEPEEEWQEDVLY